MCEVVERIRNKGIAIGIEKGRMEGARNKASRDSVKVFL